MFSGCCAHTEDGNISFWELNILTGLQGLGAKVISLRYKLGRKGTIPRVCTYSWGSASLVLHRRLNIGACFLLDFALSCPRPQSMVLPLYQPVHILSLFSFSAGRSLCLMTQVGVSTFTPL